MATVLKVWRQIENPTASIDAHLLEEIPAKFHPDPIWDDGAFGFLKTVAPTTTSQQKQDE